MALALTVALAVAVAVAQRKRDSATRRHRVVVGRRVGNAFGFAFGIAPTCSGGTTQELLKPLALTWEWPVRAHFAMVVVTIALHAAVVSVVAVSRQTTYHASWPGRQIRKRQNTSNCTCRNQSAQLCAGNRNHRFLPDGDSLSPRNWTLTCPPHPMSRAFGYTMPRVLVFHKRGDKN